MSNETTKKYYLDIEGLALFWNKLKEYITNTETQIFDSIEDKVGEYIEPIQTDISSLNEKIIELENKVENDEFARMITVGINGKQSFDISTIKTNINSAYSVENNTLICELDEIDNKTLVMTGGIIENNILYL